MKKRKHNKQRMAPTTPKDLEELLKYIQMFYPDVYPILLRRSQGGATTREEVDTLSTGIQSCFPDIYSLLITKSNLSQEEFDKIKKDIQTKINENINKSR